MSIQPEFDNPQLAAIGTTPIILRFEGLHPGDLGRFVMHNDRLGGDLSHVDPDATGRNAVLVGEDDWKGTLRAEIDTAMRHNLEENIKALKAKSRKKEASARVERGLADPWQRCRHGPLREGILTVNKAWFGGTGHLDWDPEKVAAFREAAVAFLEQSFPDGQLRYAVGHADEEAYHIHFVVAVWRERVTANRGSQILLQASMNPMIASYEHAQSLAGEAFSDLGITRGKRDAEARRAAKRAGEPVPEKRRHVPPSAWRAEQRTQAKAEAKQMKQAAEAMAGVIVGDGLSLAKATVRKSRKRAIKEAKARKQALAREVAAETRRLNVISAEAAQKKAAATAAEVDMRAAQAKITASAEKLATQMAKTEAGKSRLLAEREAEIEKLKTAQAQRTDQEVARDRAKEDIEEIISETENASAQLQLAMADLKQAQDQNVAETAAAQVEKELARLAYARRGSEDNAFEEAKSKRAVEEGKLQAAQEGVKDIETKKAAVDRMIFAVEDGIGLIADGVLQWHETPSRKAQLTWGPAAPKVKEEQISLLKRVRPASSLIKRIAQIVQKAVQVVLARERRQLAEDAAFVAGLRDDWDVEQRAKLDTLSARPAPE